jgi:hypothetical protein
VPSESGPADRTVFSRIYRLDRRIHSFDLPAILRCPKARCCASAKRMFNELTMSVKCHFEIFADGRV